MQQQRLSVQFAECDCCFVLFVFIQDLDDMEVELFSLKKKPPGSAPAQTKQSRSEGPKKDSTVQDSSTKPEGAGTSVQECFFA